MIARLRIPGGPRIQLAAENPPEPGVCSDCRGRSDSVVPMRFVRTSASPENAGQSVCVVALCPPHRRDLRASLTRIFARMDAAAGRADI